MRISGTSLRFVFALCGAVACAQSSTVCEAGTGTCTIQSVPLDQDVALTVGRPVEVGPGRVRLVFDRVVQDSRCPTDAACVWAGNATARLTVRLELDLEQTVELNTNVGAKEARFDGYLLRLVSLSPDPVSTSEIAPSAYRLTVRLQRP